MKLILQSAVIVLLLFTSTVVYAQTEKIDKQLFYLELQKAEKGLEKQLQQGDSSVILKYADVLLVNGKVKEAYDHFQLAKQANAAFTTVQTRNFRHAAVQLGLPSPFYQQMGYFDSLEMVKATVERMSFNSDFEDFGPMAWHQWVFFASARKKMNHRDKFDYALTQQPYLDVVAIDPAGASRKAPFLPADLNTEWHDGPIYLTTDTNTLFITRNHAKPDVNGRQHLYIARYERVNGSWLPAALLPFCMATYSVQHPYFDEKTSSLYFSSNMPGGKGGFDLYQSQWINGNWSAPQNLGDVVNSAFDEVFPTLDAARQLCFASNHPETHGGLDIVCMENGQRKLLPSPINTVYDDYAPHFSDANTLLFSSNRKDGAFKDDIYTARLDNYFPRKQLVYNLLASIVDAQSGKAVENASVLVIGANGDSARISLAQGNGSLGEFKGQLPALNIRVSAPGFDNLLIANLPYERFDTLLQTSIKLQPAALPLAAKGYLAIYFPNAQPRPIPTKEVATIAYGKFYQQYQQEKPVFLKLSANNDREVLDFFEDVDQGMVDLKLFPARLDTVLKTGKRIKVYMASYTSALGSAEANRAISERRGLVLKNYILNWNNGALRPYIESGQLVVNADYFPTSTPTVAGSRAVSNKAVTVYGVEASRMRRVNVVWEIAE